jgi:hypothetical protein
MELSIIALSENFLFVVDCNDRLIAGIDGVGGGFKCSYFVKRLYGLTTLAHG